MTQVSNSEVGVQPLSLRLPDAASTAAIILTQAFEYCAKKMALPNGEAAAQRLKQGDSTVCGYCHYSVAKQLGEALGALDSNVKAVYLFDYDEGPSETCLTEGVAVVPLHLLVCVDRKTDALVALLQGLDRALVQALCEKIGICPEAQVLDAQVVAIGDIENCTGYGALLRSLHNRPIQVWQR